MKPERYRAKAIHFDTTELRGQLCHMQPINPEVRDRGQQNA
jgi:hypothetical protein